MEKVVTAKYFLVRVVGLSNKEALKVLSDGRFYADGQVAGAGFRIFPSYDLQLDGKLIRKGKQLIYLAYHKPRGIESTMNRSIKNNLAEEFNQFENIFPVGRLDKESEGLMLLTNDGHLYKDLALSSAEREKEYEVTVDRDVKDEELEQLASGIVIMGQKTRPAKVYRLGANVFNITLTQGLNRQIRRMCHKLGLEVTRLIRYRIDMLELNDLCAGSWRHLDESEIQAIKRKTDQ